MNEVVYDDGFVDSIQEHLRQQIIQGDADNTTSVQIGYETLELSQKNVVTFNNHIESILIDKNSIIKIQKICESVNEPRVPWADICLGLASLFAGGLLSALISGITLETNLRSILFYILSPIIAASATVAFIFIRKQEQETSKKLAEHVMEYLPKTDLVNMNCEVKNESR